MTNRALERRDPQKGKKGFSNQKGFTVIELMITVAVIAIIASLALPSYRAIIEKRQVTSAAEQIGAFLSAVQLEAVKRGENIWVSYARTDSDTWCLGMTDHANACNCTLSAADFDPVNPGAYCEIDGQLRIVSDANLNRPDVMEAMTDGNSDGQFLVEPTRGLVFSNTSLNIYDTVELVLLSDNDSYGLNVQLSQTGRIKYCNNVSGSKDVPGYDPCQ